MKKFLSLILSLAVLLSISSPTVLAGGSNVDTSQFYEEKGQIVFDSIDIKNVNGKLEIQNSSNLGQAQELSNILTDKDFEQVLIDLMVQDKNPLAVGWTRLYLKESQDGSFVPMTIAEVQREQGGITPNYTKIGVPTTKPLFTLYTLIGYDNWAPNDIFAWSVATWTNGGAGPDGPSYLHNDFITMTWPEGYVVTHSNIFGNYMSSGWKSDEDYRTVVWTFVETYGTVTLDTLAVNSTYTGGLRKWVSNYTHCWQEPNAQLSVIPVPPFIQVHFSDINKNWTAASSVTY